MYFVILLQTGPKKLANEDPTHKETFEHIIMCTVYAGLSDRDATSTEDFCVYSGGS